MKKIMINLKALETMLFIWASLRDREKVNDLVLMDLAKSPEMMGAIEEDFSENSIRKVLSAISNRELMNTPTKKESRFWNYNMWMLEDKEMTDLMLSPIKTLNVDELVDEFKKIKYDEIEVIFFPGHMSDVNIMENKIFINFFKLKADIYGDGAVTIDELPIKDYVRLQLEKIS